MKLLLEKVVKSFVDNPSDVKVAESQLDGITSLSLSVNPADMGKVIGKSGKIAKALRLMLRIPALKNGAKVNLEIVESTPSSS